jgi:hypothetical protein
METVSARIKAEVARVLEVVCELTGLISHWNGTLELIENAEFRGRKPFTCGIQIDSELAQLPERWATVIHESLHAVSAGYDRNDFQMFRGWEEGVVEKLQRLIRPTVLARLGVTVDESTWQQHEANHRYNEYINALEEIRSALTVPEAEEPLQFYIALLGTPIKDRPGAVLGMGYRRAELPRTPFVRAFSAASAVLTRRTL